MPSSAIVQKSFSTGIFAHHHSRGDSNVNAAHDRKKIPGAFLPRG
jgi:hypothetical protein